MAETITTSEFVARLSGILSRVQYRQEQFIIEQNGAPVAPIGPVCPQPGVTLRELIAEIGSLPRPDDRFADDLEEIHASQAMLGEPRWPS